MKHPETSFTEMYNGTPLPNTGSIHCCEKPGLNAPNYCFQEQ